MNDGTRYWVGWALVYKDELGEVELSVGKSPFQLTPTLFSSRKKARHYKEASQIVRKVVLRRDG